MDTPNFQKGETVQYKPEEEGRREGWRYEVLDMQERPDGQHIAALKPLGVEWPGLIAIYTNQKRLERV